MGGHSRPPFDTNNMGLHVGDDPESVVQNRAALPVDNIGWLQQVHGTDCVQLPMAGSASLQADASYSRAPGITCAVMTADCLPVLLSDVNGTVVAAVHAGWRGLIAGVIERTLCEMDQDPVSLTAWIGPAISAPFFEVGDDVAGAFEQSPQVRHFHADSGKWHIDLPLAAKYRLLDLGVKDVTLSGLCTYKDDALFFSHRRATHRGVPSTGRMVCGITLLS